MKKLFFSLTLFSLLAATVQPLLAQAPPAAAPAAPAPAAEAPKPKDPSLEERVAEIEAYMNNVARPTTGNTNGIVSKVAGPGPGHNAWHQRHCL